MTRCDGLESHCLVRTSPELPEAFREDCAQLSFGNPRRREFIPNDDDPDRPHSYWRWYNKWIVKHGITVRHIQRAVAEYNSRQKLLRDGVGDFIKLCNEHGVPVVVVSAGFGDLIDAALELEGIPASSCRVLSSRLVMDAEGKRCVRVVPEDPPASRAGKQLLLTAQSDLASRRCLVCVGDKPIDSAAVQAYPRSGGAPPTALRIGFLNDPEADPDTVAEYAEAFDVLIAGGSGVGFESVTDIVRDLLHPRPAARQ